MSAPPTNQEDARAQQECICGWPERDCAIRAWGSKPEDNLHIPCADRASQTQSERATKGGVS